jgi:Spy/CpxP family protein refolding chaperone
MKRWLGTALAISLAINVGVIAAAGYQSWRMGRLPQASYFGMPHEDIPHYLGLSAEQRARWHALEEGFLAALASDAREIGAHRERMIRMIFSESADAAAVEAERAAIFALQERQQRRIVAQLLKEREMLAPEQRAKLAELLVRQRAPLAAAVEHLAR